MKIEIDTVNKTIIIKESINVQELINELETLGINKKEYEIINYMNYTYYPSIPYYQFPNVYTPQITVTSNI